MDKPAIGFIGLGRMGGPMARNLAQAGYAVSVFDVDTAAAANAVSVPGTTRHDSPGDVAASAAVLFTARSIRGASAPMMATSASSRPRIRAATGT